MNETTSTRAVLSLVCGVLAVTGTCPCVGSIAAIALGWGERSGTGRAGLILGWVSLALCLGAVLLVAAVGLAGVVVELAN